MMTKWFGAPRPPGVALAIIRSAAGLVFVASALVKLLYENQGVLRFEKLALPGALAPMVSGVELVAGVLLAAGLFARPAAMALAIDMLVAIVTSKVPLLFGPGPEPLGSAPKVGFFAFAYQARLDLFLLAVCASIVLTGAGELSLDDKRNSRTRAALEPG